MIKYIIQKNPDKKFVIRPHPAEDIRDWEKILNNIKNDNYSIVNFYLFFNTKSLGFLIFIDFPLPDRLGLDIK